MWFAKLKRRIAKYSPQIRLASKIVFPLIFITLLFKIVWPYFVLATQALTGPVNVVSVFFPKETTLLSDQGRTNVLLLGIGGGNHEGPDLTDSMMLLSINTDPKRSDHPPIVLISIPRDIYLNSISDKVNSAYYVGNEKRPGSGFILAKSVVSQITGLSVHYSFLVDFSGFEKAIDLLGGVDVNIEQTLDDPQYPIAGKENDLCALPAEQMEETYTCRYENLHFAAGLTHLDGAQSLKFVRSRHTLGSEGTDFARAKRQQLLLLAVKNKVFSSEILLNPTAMSNVFNTFKNHISTDISPNEMAVFLKLAIKNKSGAFKSLVLDDQFFVNPPIDYRGWILLPKDGSFDEIHQYIQKFLEQTDSPSKKQN